MVAHGGDGDSDCDIIGGLRCCVSVGSAGIVVFAILTIVVDADSRNVNIYTVPVYG